MENNRYNRILVTGSTGFVGSVLARSLSEHNHALRVLVRDSSLRNLNSELRHLEIINGDLLNPDDLEEACVDQQVVVHLAARAHVSNKNSNESRRSIVEGTQYLLNAAINQHVKRIIYVSSSLAHGADTDTGDVTDYGKLKKAAEDLLLEAQAKGLIEVVILRPVNVYGAGMQGNIAGMIALVSRNRLPPLPAVGSRISLVGVTDLAEAIRLAITAVNANGKTYTVTDGQEYKILEIEKAIYAALGKRIPGWRTPRVILFAAAFSAEIFSLFRRNSSSIGLRTYRNIAHDNLFGNSAICEDLGFQPSTTFYKELPHIIANFSQKPQNR